MGPGIDSIPKVISGSVELVRGCSGTSCRISSGALLLGRRAIARRLLFFVAQAVASRAPIASWQVSLQDRQSDEFFVLQGRDSRHRTRLVVALASVLKAHLQLTVSLAQASQRFFHLCLYRLGLSEDSRDIGLHRLGLVDAALFVETTGSSSCDSSAFHVGWLHRSPGIFVSLELGEVLLRVRAHLRRSPSRDVRSNLLPLAPVGLETQQEGLML